MLSNLYENFTKHAQKYHKSLGQFTFSIPIFIDPYASL